MPAGRAGTMGRLSEEESLYLGFRASVARSLRYVAMFEDHCLALLGISPTQGTKLFGVLPYEKTST